MRIDWIVPCRYAELQPDGSLNITGAGVDTLWIPDQGLESDLTMLFAIRVIGAPDEVVELIHLVVLLTRPDGGTSEPLASIALQAQSPAAVMPGGDSPLAFPLALSFKARDFGDHAFTFVLADSSVDVPFAVRRVAERPETASAASAAAEPLG